jgi:hypothetical protein
MVIIFSKNTGFSVSRGEATKSLWWMPWRQVPMKDVGHCDKPRGAVNRRYIRGFPNGETRCREPTALPSEYIGWQGAPGELKHLSTQRKRDHSLSSGERKGKSPNHSSLLEWGCRAWHMEVTKYFVSGKVWESLPKRVTVPYAKTKYLPPGT